VPQYFGKGYNYVIARAPVVLTSMAGTMGFGHGFISCEVHGTFKLCLGLRPKLPILHFWRG